MSEYGKARTLAASLRLPNLPSVLSNTTTGVILVMMLIGLDVDPLNPLLAWLSATCLYFSGNLLNDWADLTWDHSHRPERALPSGLFKPCSFLIAAILLTVAACAAAVCASWQALVVSIAISINIFLYTWLHKRTAWSVIPMALCRALLPVLGIFAITDVWNKPYALPAILLFIYLIMLTLRARSESKPDAAGILPTLSSIGLLMPPAIGVAFWFQAQASAHQILLATAATMPYLLWTVLALTRHRMPVSRQVSALLAGIPLVDSLILLPLALIATLQLNQPFTIVLLFLWLPAFIGGRLLQRLVPAT